MTVPQLAWTKLDYINLAMNVLGKKSVASIEDSGEFADSAKRAFDLLYPKEIAQYDWRFATKIEVLSQLVTAPPDPMYTLAYNLPSDYLSLRRLHPATTFFQIYQKELWTNVNNLKMEYRFLPDPSQCPSYFVNYFVLVLAKWFAKSVAEDSRLANELANEIRIEKGTAMYVDAQSRPTHRLFQNPVIDARFNFYIGDGYYGNGVF